MSGLLELSHEFPLDPRRRATGFATPNSPNRYDKFGTTDRATDSRRTTR